MQFSWIFPIITFTMIITIMVTIVIMSAVYKTFIIRPTISKEKDKRDINPEECDYRKKQYLLTKNEYEFYKQLRPIANQRGLTICPKVRLADIIEAREGENWQLAFNGIKSKHIDFLLCQGALSPVLAIELDDNSHGSDVRINRDKFVDHALFTARIPIIRTRGPGDLNRLISEKLDRTTLVV